MSYTIFDKSRVSKCYAMTTNLRLKIPTCHAYIFERLLSYVFNRINNFIMVLIETVGQKTNIGDSESSRPKIRESETQRNKRKRDFETHSKRLRDFANSRLEEKFPRPWIFQVPFATPKVACTFYRESFGTVSSGCCAFWRVLSRLEFTVLAENCVGRVPFRLPPAFTAHEQYKCCKAGLTS